MTSNKIAPPTDFGQHKETGTSVQFWNTPFRLWLQTYNYLQHPGNYTEKRSTNRHWLYTNYAKNHLHYETQVLTLRDHINMRGIQFLAAASANPDQPCHYILTHQPTPRSIKTTPQALYTGFLNIIPQHSNSHIHTHFSNIAIQKLCPKHIRYSTSRNTPLRQYMSIMTLLMLQFRSLILNYPKSHHGSTLINLPLM